jgi:hypothetical protein
MLRHNPLPFCSGSSPPQHLPLKTKTQRPSTLKSIDDNIIHFEKLTYGPKDPSWCPSHKGETNLRAGGPGTQGAEETTETGIERLRHGRNYAATALLGTNTHTTD